MLELLFYGGILAAFWVIASSAKRDFVLQEHKFLISFGHH